MGEGLQAKDEVVAKEVAKEPIRGVLWEVEKLRGALEEERRRADGYLVRLKYLQADFDNYRRRTEKEIKEMVKQGNERLIIKLLDVLDDLERATVAGREAKGKEALLKGVEMVLKGLKGIFEHEGVKRIDALGKPFNPNQHDAVDRVETEEFPDNTIIEELRKGYMLNDKVIRPSMVKVAMSMIKGASKG